MHKLGTCWIFFALLIVALPARADFLSNEHFRAFADFRLRLESDFDSQNAAGVPRDDRTRMRVRARLGVHIEPDEHWRVELRLRTGQQASQQSPHITILDFDGNDTGDASFDFDLWNLRGRTGNFWATAGRDSLPIWRQDEELFDDDVTFAGVALGSGHRLGPGELSWSGGYFSSPVGMRAFTGNLGLVQLVYEPTLRNVRWAFALGGFSYDANPDDPEATGLLQNNGFRDYSVLELSSQASWKVRGRTLTLGGDLMHNLQDYARDDPDPITAANFDQTDGFVFLGTYGSLDARNAWLVGYYYAHLELFAVHNSYSQDDWVRWGTATQTRASNMKGHELRFGWALHANMNVIARLYVVNAITSIEDGNRFRIDFNYGF